MMVLSLPTSRPRPLDQYAGCGTQAHCEQLWGGGSYTTPTTPAASFNPKPLPDWNEPISRSLAIVPCVPFALEGVQSQGPSKTWPEPLIADASPNPRSMRAPVLAFGLDGVHRNACKVLLNVVEE